MTSILIVEDEDSLRETLSRFLGREGHEVVAAADGRRAFDLGISLAPDVIVADWMLKDHIHGLHVSEALKVVNPALRTILITGFPSRELLFESERCGVLQLLEKPFNLQEFQSAVANAAEAAAEVPAGALQKPVAVVELDRDGGIRFANDRARELFAQTAAGRDAKNIQDLLSPEAQERLRESSRDWVMVRPLGATRERGWLVRGRDQGSDQGRLLVLFPDDEEARTTDSRIRILLDHSSRSRPILLDHGPVIVIEHDSAVRRLLVSQIERIGALCFAADDLAAALRLLVAEPRAQTVLLDFALARDAMPEWVRRIRAVCPDAVVVGTGGSASEEDLLALGVARVLKKPWRLMDLLDVMTH